MVTNMLVGHLPDEFGIADDRRDKWDHSYDDDLEVWILVDCLCVECERVQAILSVGLVKRVVGEVCPIDEYDMFLAEGLDRTLIAVVALISAVED